MTTKQKSMGDCVICGDRLYGLTCENEYCNQGYCECSKCKKVIPTFDAYDYRGAESCADCFDSVQEFREHQRQEVISEEHKKTDVFKGLDLGDNVIGKANREILKPSIEIASREGGRLKDYERPNLTTIEVDDVERLRVEK